MLKAASSEAAFIFTNGKTGFLTHMSTAVISRGLIGASFFPE
jgi:hypothetical protein